MKLEILKRAQGYSYAHRALPIRVCWSSDVDTLAAGRTLLSTSFPASEVTSFSCRLLRSAWTESQIFAKCLKRNASSQTPGRSFPFLIRLSQWFQNTIVYFRGRLLEFALDLDLAFSRSPNYSELFLIGIFPGAISGTLPSFDDLMRLTI